MLTNLAYTNDNKGLNISTDVKKCYQMETNNVNPNPPGGGQICPPVFQTRISLEPNVGLTSNQAVNSS